MISIKHRWLFIHIPKTGGNSLSVVLQPHSDDRFTLNQYQDGDHRFGISGEVTANKHDTLKDYWSRLGKETYGDLFRFSIVRNPWERAVSMYFSPSRWVRSERQPAWDLAAFAETLAVMPPMLSYVSLCGGGVDLDDIIRFENLESDAKRVLGNIGIAIERLPCRNRGHSPRPWRDYYKAHPHLIGMVRERFVQDIEAFGYEPPAA